MMMMRRLVATFTLFCFFLLSIFPSSAYADETNPIGPLFESVSPLSKGDRAPFQGILFSKDLAARIEAERKTMITLRLSEARTNAAVSLIRSELQLKLDIASGKFLALEEKHKKIVEINREQIEFLRKQYLPTPWYEHPAFLVTVGIIAGIGLTIGAAHIVKTVK
jgi:hypothetical protein